MLMLRGRSRARYVSDLALIAFGVRFIMVMDKIRSEQGGRPRSDAAREAC